MASHEAATPSSARRSQAAGAVAWTCRALTSFWQGVVGCAGCCVAASNITASYASAAHRCAPSGRIRGRYVLRPSGKCRHKSRSTSITSGEGQQNGAGVSSPLRLLLLGQLRRFILPVYLLSLRGFDNSRSAFYLSRQRHGAGMNQMRLHRHATAAVCGSCASTKKLCRTKPRHRLFHCHTPPWTKVRLGRCALCFIVPAHTVCQAARGRAALLLSRSSCHASHPLAGRVCAGRRTPFCRHTACCVKPLLNPQGAP